MEGLREWYGGYHAASRENRGKKGEEGEYTGRVLAVGIGYGKETKKQECRVEWLAVGEGK